MIIAVMRKLKQLRKLSLKFFFRLSFCNCLIIFAHVTAIIIHLFIKMINHSRRSALKKTLSYQLGAFVNGPVFTKLCLQNAEVETTRKNTTLHYCEVTLTLRQIVELLFSYKAHAQTENGSNCMEKRIFNRT